MLLAKICVVPPVEVLLCSFTVSDKVMTNLVNGFWVRLSRRIIFCFFLTINGKANVSFKQ